MHSSEKVSPRGEIPRIEIPRGEIPRGEIPRGEIPRGEIPRGEIPGGQSTKSPLPSPSPSPSDLSLPETPAVYYARSHSFELVLNFARSCLAKYLPRLRQVFCYPKYITSFVALSNLTLHTVHPIGYSVDDATALTSDIV